MLKYINSANNNDRYSQIANSIIEDYLSKSIDLDKFVNEQTKRFKSDCETLARAIERLTICCFDIQKLEDVKDYADFIEQLSRIRDNLGFVNLSLDIDDRFDIVEVDIEAFEYTSFNRQISTIKPSIATINII